MASLFEMNSLSASYGTSIVLQDVRLQGHGE